MKIKTLMTSLVLIGLSAFAQADINYTYAQAVYQIYSEADAYIWEVKGSYQMNDKIYVSMEDQTMPTIFSGQRSGSIGTFVALENGMHIYGQVGLADSAPDMAPILEAGVRLEANGDFEVRGALRIEPELPVGGGDTGETMIIGEALFHLEGFDVVGGLVLPSELDGNVMRFGVRKNF
jgi:hypothetical protein